MCARAPVRRRSARWRARVRAHGRTERARSLMRSRALMMMKGSHVLRVVLTVIEPSIRSSVHAMCTSLSARVTCGHASRIAFSRYCGKSTANDDSSSRWPARLSSLVKGIGAQRSTLSSSKSPTSSSTAPSAPSLLCARRPLAMGTGRPSRGCRGWLRQDGTGRPLFRFHGATPVCPRAEHLPRARAVARRAGRGGRRAALAAA